MNRIMRKPVFCICHKKAADQLVSAAPLHMSRVMRPHKTYDPSRLLRKSKISSLKSSSVAVQPGLYHLVGNPKDSFSCDEADIESIYM